jgi:hypothetical protein
MDSTARIGLPLLVAGQGQKEITHNEALILLDAVIGCIVESRNLEVPPDSPGMGMCWLVPSDATGDWAGKAGRIAVSTAGGWRFLLPFEGATLFVRDGRERLRRLDDAWITDTGSGAPREAIPNPTGGSVVDSEARATVAAILDRLRELGLLAMA